MKNVLNKSMKLTNDKVRCIFIGKAVKKQIKNKNSQFKNITIEN